MELFLTVQLAASGGTRRHGDSTVNHSVDGGGIGVDVAVDVAVAVSETHLCGDVAAALASALRPADPAARTASGGEPGGRTAGGGAPGDGEPGGWLLARPSTGEVFDPGESFMGTGITSGDQLVLCEATVADWLIPSVGNPGSGSDHQSVVVCGGPDTGLEVAMPTAGRLAVGRDPAAGLRLSDPTVGRADLWLGVGDRLGSVTIETTGKIPVSVDGRPVGRATTVEVGQRIGIGHTMLVVRSPAPCPRPLDRTSAEIPLTPGADRTHPARVVVIQAVSELPQPLEPPSFALVAALAPLAMGIALALLYSPRFLLFALFAPLVAGAGWVDQWRRNKRRRRRDLARLNQDLERARSDAEQALDVERSTRWERAPDLVELCRRAAARGPDLWDRDPNADEAFEARLGVGAVAPLVRIELPERGDEATLEQARNRLTGLDTLPDVPITIDLRRNAVVALTGADEASASLLRSILLHLACIHSPRNLALVLVAHEHRGVDPWAKWIPHAYSVPVGGAGLGDPRLADSSAGADALLTELVALAQDRAEQPPSGSMASWSGPRARRHLPFVVVAINASVVPDPSLVDRLCELAPAAGMAVVVLADEAAAVPGRTTAVVECRSPIDSEPTTLARFTDSGWEETPFLPDAVGRGFATRCARLLTPLRDASAALESGDVPAVVELFDVFATESVDADWVARRWRRRRDGCLAIPVGSTAEGPMILDLSGHGPHTLVGGTSGSGKSELITSLVASLIAHHPPGHVNVLFVDYKGGAVGELFESIPHNVGSVTNLDAALARRALVSLRAELTFRMSLLRGRAKDLQQLVELAPHEAPPAIVIVIDEFATLVSEVPEFMEGVIDIAQRGRSLGIHLVLATQRPAVAVNDNILANTNLRLCLRTVDGAESSAVIGSPEAAAIPVEIKGRGLVSFGRGRFETFQTAWAGAAVPTAGVERSVEVRPFTGTPGSARLRIAATGTETSPGSAVGGRTQLDAVVHAVTGAAEAIGASPARRPWLDELPTRIALEPLQAAEHPESPASQTGHSGLSVAIGLVDDPAAQAQYPLVLDVASGGGLMVFGTGGSGKTTVLRTVALSVLARPVTEGPHGRGPQVFVIDAASHELSALAALPGCVAVATGDDLEAVTRIISLLREEIDRRRRGDQWPVGADGPLGGDRPPILLLIDDYGSVLDAFEGPGASGHVHVWAERLQRVVIDGPSVGVHTVMTAARRGVVRAAVWAAVSHRLVLRCVEAAGAVELGVPPDAAAGLVATPPGRGWLNGAAFVQIAVAAGPDGLDPDVTSVGAAHVGSGWGSSAHQRHVVEEYCRRLPPVSDDAARPDPLHVGPLPDDVPPYPPIGHRLGVRLGRVDLRAAPLDVDLASDDLTIVGPPGSGRTTTLAGIAWHLESNGATVWACGPERSALGASVAPHRWAPAPPVGPGEVNDILGALGRALDMAREDEDAEAANVLLIDDLDELDDPSLSESWHHLVQRRVRLVAAVGSLRGFSPNPLLVTARKARHQVLLGPPGPMELHELMGRPMEIRPGIRRVPGRAVVVSPHGWHVVQIAQAPVPSRDRDRPERSAVSSGSVSSGLTPTERR